MNERRIAILGAGPIGLEAALAGRELGHDVDVYERGAIGANIERWGHVRLFSPFAMNHSQRGAENLEAEGRSLPDGDSYLTGAEHLERYLSPLGRCEALSGRVHLGKRIVSIGREGLGKRDLLEGPRDAHPFRLLIENDAGDEELVVSDLVFDCTGTYGNHQWMGSGNLPALGERQLEARIDYEVPDLLVRDRTGFEGQRVLVVGGGHSASTALDGLLALDGVTVHWVIRKARPMEIIAEDPLPERKRLSELANAVAAGAHPKIEFHGEHQVERIRRVDEAEAFEVSLRSGARERVVTVDRVLALVGYQPDNSLYRQIQVHECYASHAPMKLAAAMMGESSADCLKQSSHGPDVLTNPEPGFFILGAKSYGNGSNFLIRTGLQQIDDVFGLLDKDARRERVS